MDLFKEEKKERNQGLYGCGGAETHDVAFQGLGVHLNTCCRFCHSRVRECIARVYSYVSFPTQVKLEPYSTPSSQSPS